MQFVEPIRDEKKIAQIKNQLRWSWKIRDLLLFELWINSALRISDLLSVRICDVFDEKNEIREFFDIKEDKTNKTSRVTITPKVLQTLELYKTHYPQLLNRRENYIFFHQKQFPQGIKSINRGMAWILINERCEWVGLKGNYGGHTLRKTWWYQARMKWIAMELIQHKLNHSSMAITKKYLWITDDELSEACYKLDL